MVKPTTDKISTHTAMLYCPSGSLSKGRVCLAQLSVVYIVEKIRICLLQTQYMVLEDDLNLRRMITRMQQYERAHFLQ